MLHKRTIFEPSFSLGVIKSRQGSILSFISDVSLQGHVVWSGGIRVTWDSAVARSGVRSLDKSQHADMYKLVLRVGEGKLKEYNFT